MDERACRERERERERDADQRRGGWEREEVMKGIGAVEEIQLVDALLTYSNKAAGEVM